MWSFDEFQLPDGARVVGQQGSEIEMQISIPTDEDGFVGRECPDCEQVFRMQADDHGALPDDVELWCVYCGRHAGKSEFLTQQQLNRIKRAAGDIGEQILGQALDHVLRPLARQRPRSRSGLSIQVSYRSKPFYPQPLPGIDEERLIRIRSCATCALRYGVFGEHRYCPVCGLLPPEVVAMDALAAEEARLDGLLQLPVEAAATLREQGVFTRIWVDTLENLVGIVETLAASVFHAAVADATQKVKGKGNIFQRLDDTADLFTADGYADLRTLLDDPTWQRLKKVWATRHAFTHNDGIVDNKYLTQVPASTAQLGQRLTITEALCRQAIADTRALCESITDLTVP
jgi:hypothetical protein